MDLNPLKHDKGLLSRLSCEDEIKGQFWGGRSKDIYIYIFEKEPFGVY